MESNSVIVSIGCRVEISLLNRDDKREQLSFTVVADESADFANGFLGESTPLAQIIMGEKSGIVIPYLKDDIFAIEILSVTPSTIKPPDDIAEKRQAMMEKTIREVEHTNAVVFASSFSGKWGDYDPDSLPEVNKQNEKKPKDNE
jgi:hypothetical protein